MVDVGNTAPRFDLKGVSPDREIRGYDLDELTDGKALVLGVYVFDFSPVCSTQMCDVSGMNWMTFEQDLNVVGVSGDGPYSHQKFIEEEGISYPLLCDTNGELTAEYGVQYEEKDGFRALPKRSMFLIDSEQQIRYKWVAEDNWDTWTNNPLEEIQKKLSEIRQR